MDFRIFYLILGIIVGSTAESCSVSETECTYELSCTNVIDSYMSWDRFRRRPSAPSYPVYGGMYDDISSQTECQTIRYGPYAVYPIYLTLKQTIQDTNPIPVKYGGGNEIINMIYSLDISDNRYDESPVLRGMQNLVVLNISRNHLTTAVLSNENELNMLASIDFSYNTINDIQVKHGHLYKKLTTINLSHNYLVKVPDAIFDELDNLQILDLSYNYIDTLSQFTFEGVKKLVDLNLSNNRLTGINSSLFRFSELKVLNLANNGIEELKPNDLEQLAKLKSLDLSSNLIKTINANIFDKMTLLQTINLSNNKLYNLNQNTFTGLQSLTGINLSKNLFKILPKGAFKNTSIYTFSITENILEGSLEKGMFEGINVTSLDLSNQYLTEIHDYTFFDLTRLEILLLNSNSITSLSNMCFKTLVRLNQLDLSGNQISNPDFDKTDLFNLRSLILKNNRLTEIKHEQLLHLNSLEFLDLSENQIFRLEPGSFRSLSNLINLGINSNPLVGTLKTGTFNGLTLLPSLDISHNQLSMVQNASFTDMTGLKELNMSSCNISELQYNVFDRTGYIETLDLSYNKLEEFFVNTTDLVALSTLLLNNNMIKVISSSSLNGLSGITKVTLSHNHINNVQYETFISLIDLRHLDVSYNKYMNFTVTLLNNTTNLQTLILSGIKTSINFANIRHDIPIADLKLSNASIQNISGLHLGSIEHLDLLDLSFNNVTRLQIGDFKGLTTIRFLDISYNRISFIQPGVFKDITLLHSLNVSHNHLSSVGYGIFRGLIYLNILDMSYNKIKDLQSERFYEVKSLSELIVDHNRIDYINAEEFSGTSLSKLSIGDNPLPCQILVKLAKTEVPFRITAIDINENSNENVNGVTCNKVKSFESTTIPNQEGGNIDILNNIRNILHNFTNANIGHSTNDIQYLAKIANNLEKSNSIYDDRLSNLVNLTSEVIAINNNTYVMLSKIIDALDRNHAVVTTSTPIAQTKPVTSTSTNAPLTVNESKINQTIDPIAYMNAIKKHIEESLAIEKQNIINEIENRLAIDKQHTESLPSSVGHEKLVSGSESSKSLFTETCVGLILVILVGLVLYKFYRSRMFIRNRLSISTHELPGAMENSNL